MGDGKKVKMTVTKKITENDEKDVAIIERNCVIETPDISERNDISGG